MLRLTAGGSASSQRSCEWLCERLAPASCPSLTIAWTYGNPCLAASAARCCHASATRTTSSGSSSASELTCRGDETTTSWFPCAGRDSRSPTCRAGPLSSGANAGNLFGTTRTSQPGVSGRPLGRPERERLRRSAVFVALAERAARNVHTGPATWSRAWGAGPARAKRRDDHPPAGERVAPELSPLGIVQPPSFDRSSPCPVTHLDQVAARGRAGAAG